MTILAAALLTASAGAGASDALPTVASEEAPASGSPPIDKRRYTLFNPTPRAALREFSPDRPDITESPFTVDAGHFQVELSLVEDTLARDGGARTDTLDVAPINLKLGLTNRIDLQVLFTPFERVATRDGTRPAVEGFGDDTQVRLKVNLWGDDTYGKSGKTAFALMPFVKVPTGKAGIGNGHVEGGLILPLAVELPAGFDLATMVELDAVYDEDRDDYGVDVVHSASLGHRLVGRLAGYVEYVGVAPRSGGGGYRAVASSGLVYGLNDNWNVDAGGTLGLSGRTDDLRVFVGTSVRF